MKFKKRKAILLCATLCMGLSSCDKIGEKSGTEAAPKAEVPQVDLVQQIKECSKIYTSEYQVSKIVVKRDQKGMHGKVMGLNVNFNLAGGERVIAIPIKGVLKAYVDMADFKPENLHENGDSLEVVLPDPKIMLTSTKITAKDIKEKIGFMQSKFSDKELTALQQQGRDSLIAEVPRLGIIENARKSAARTLVSLLSSFGYEESKITITFKTDDKDMSTVRRVKEMLVESVN